MIFDVQLNELAHFLLRWFHFIFGIFWIGHLYFFNFTNANFMTKIDAATKSKVIPELMPRALFWFRMGAMITFLTGWGMLLVRFLPTGFQGFFASPYGHWIALGALFGSIMWFNVWFIIWPSQKKIITAVKNGEAPDPSKVELARKASKINTFLSIPMLFSMGAAMHLPSSHPAFAIGAIAIGFLIAQLIYKRAPHVGTSI